MKTVNTSAEKPNNKPTTATLLSPARKFKQN